MTADHSTAGKTLKASKLISAYQAQPRLAAAAGSAAPPTLHTVTTPPMQSFGARAAAAPTFKSSAFSLVLAVRNAGAR